MTWMWPIVILIGLGGGLLVNYLADQLPRWRALSTPRCLHCEQSNPFFELYLLQRACIHCGRQRPHLTRALILIAVVLSTTIWLWVSPPPRLGFWVGFLISLLFYVILVIDLEHRLILQSVSVSGAVLCLGAGWWLRGLQVTLMGGVAGFGIMYLLYVLGQVFSRVVSRMRGEDLEEVALGFGDVNLGGMLGLVLGWPVILLGLILAILAGGGFSLVFMLAAAVLGRYRSFVAMPYAPFMILAAGVILFFPEFAKFILGSISPLMGAAMAGP